MARPRVPGEIRMTRRAYLAQLLRVIRWQGAASLKIKIKRHFEDFWPKFYSVWKVRKFVLQFDNFPGQEKWNDERMQSESSRRRRNDEFIDSQKLIFWWIFITSCYVLNKIAILSEISTPEWSGTIPGQEIAPGIRNSWWNHPKTIRNWENDKIEGKRPKYHSSLNFRPWKWIFALLTQQIMWIATPEENF